MFSPDFARDILDAVKPAFYCLQFLEMEVLLVTCVGRDSNLPIHIVHILSLQDISTKHLPNIFCRVNENSDAEAYFVLHL